ncbi:MAG: glycosyltransferase, partial [Phycisphaeraceae bacterium]
MADYLHREVCPDTDVVSTPPAKMVRPHIRGKFFFVEEEKYYVKGVTYGPFAPDERHGEYGTPNQVAIDFKMMAEMGLNTLRVYTVPPKWLLDKAQNNGLRVFIGIPWEQHISFLDEKGRTEAIVSKVRETARLFSGHPAIFAYAIGNEIPPSIVRWYGKKKIERFLKRLYLTIKREDESALVTYVNFPTTEYLQNSFLDFQCFNVYLEKPAVLRNYLARLQTLADSRPLLMGEVGLDSRRNGVEKQAEVLDWQIEESFAAGTAGTFIFAWTDKWHRGGMDIDDWDFGLTTRQDEPKPALYTVKRAFAQTPFRMERDWPMISVVICTYNGSKTIEETLRSMSKVQYPDFEVVVVNDGSQDQTPTIIYHMRKEFEGRVTIRQIDIDNGGLSNARNVGMHEARGEIVAYLDDDAYPDPHWLMYLADSFMTKDCIGVGGPNLPIPEDNDAAFCVAHSPGGPNHVLTSDEIAEHIPGCNMAFRKSALLQVGGCDTQFRIAGDDVDLCWRLQDECGEIAFNAAAMVWHHRRDSIKGYLKQQRNYGRAEAMLQKKWPKKYNSMGHIAWGGRIYGSGLTAPLMLRPNRVYHGVWGSNLFQTLYTREPGMMHYLPMMPEWFLLIIAAAVIAVPGMMWWPSIFITGLALLMAATPVAQALLTAKKIELRDRSGRFNRIRLRLIIAYLHLAQPLVRLQGRITQGLTPWRRPKASKRFCLPRLKESRIWQEKWMSAETALATIEYNLHHIGAHPERGGDFD